MAGRRAAARAGGNGRSGAGRAAGGRAAGGRATGRPAGRPATSVAPSLREERRLLRSGYTVLAGIDEVGRGALAGPVTVGIVLVDAATKSAPAGVRDSKLLAPAVREALVPRIRRWALAYAVGHAEPDEIDRIGIIAALRLAASRAMESLPVRPDCVLLDGSHDWLTPPNRDLLPADTPALFDLPAEVEPPPVVDVVTRVKADLRCAAVAAASVLAKVERDGIMVARAADYPGYCWELNKGYSAPEHAAALRRLGPSPQHRQSWSLPGAGELGQVEVLEGLEDLGGEAGVEPFDLDSAVVLDVDAAAAGDAADAADAAALPLAEPRANGALAPSDAVATSDA